MTPSQNNIEDVLCSKTTLKMLKVSMQSELLTVSEIAKRTSVNYVSARTHLETLENGNILAHVMFGKRIRYYKFKDSPIAKAVKDLIEVYSDR
jgi:ribosomal protein S25